MPAFPIVTLKPEPFAYVTITSPITGIAQAMGEGFGRLGGMFSRAGAEMAGMPMCHYIDYDGTSTTFQLGFPCRPVEVGALGAAGLSIGETPSGETMKAVHVGPYDTVVSTYNAMTEAMKSQGTVGARDMWEVYHSPPETRPEAIRTEILWPVLKAG